MKKSPGSKATKRGTFERLEERLPFAVELISVVSGVGGNNTSFVSSVSDDGRYVVFESIANNLVANDTNNAWDIFLKDRQTGTVSLVSSDANGAFSSGNSRSPVISGNGRYVVFESSSTDLVQTDTNGVVDVYRKDLQTGGIIHTSVDSQGNEYGHSSSRASINYDGRYVSFLTDEAIDSNDTNNSTDVYVKDLGTGVVINGSTDGSDQFVASAFVTYAAISGDGAHIAFSSTGIFSQSDTNLGHDVFLKNLQTGAITFVSTDAQGNFGDDYSDGPHISSDGTYVTFQSYSQNLVSGSTANMNGLYRKNTVTGAIQRANFDPGGDYFTTSNFIVETEHGLSSDGNVVAFSVAETAGPIGGSFHVFAKNFTTGEVLWLDTLDGTTVPNGHGLFATLNGDGDLAVYSSTSTDLLQGVTATGYQIFASPVNAAPAAVTDTARTLPGDDIDIDVLDNDTDAENDTLTVTAVGTPSHGTAAINQNGTVKYTPTSQYVGNDSFTYTISDGNGHTSQGTVNVTVDTDPVATTDSLVTQLDGAILIAPLYNDTDADSHTLSIASITQPSHGTAQLLNGVVVQYTPQQGYFGNDSFTYVADDGFGGTVQGTIQVRVNRGPTAVNDRVVTLMNRAVQVAPVFNDTDPDGDSLTMVSIFNVTGGSASFSGGVIDFTPTNGFTGLATVSYAIIDGNLGLSTATVTIQVFDVTRFDGDRLWVHGYDVGETFVVRPAGVSSSFIELLYNGVSRGTFGAASIVVLGMAGNDSLTVATNMVGNTTVYVTIPVSLHGNDGDDVLSAADTQGVSILVGGAGNDTLTGGGSRDILAGGSGVDLLDGGGEEDILVPGNFADEYSQVTYDYLMSEWARNDTFTARKQHIEGTLSGGANQSFLLNAGVMIDDSAADTLFGRNGRDWLFAELNNADTALRDILGDFNGDDVTSL